MKWRFTGKLILVILALMLTAVPFLVGCGGGEEEEENTIVLGWLGDQTGVSAGAFKEVIWGMEDYLAEMDPIPGLKIDLSL